LLTRLDQLLRVCLTASAFFFFYLGGAAMSWILLPALRTTGRDAAERSARCRSAVSRAFLLFHDYMRWTRILHHDPRELARKLPKGAYVLVANHPTLVDVTALVAANSDISCVVKQTLIKSPILGRLLRYCWYIVADTSGPSGAAGVALGAIRRLEAGLPVVIFPEGTRSPEGGLRDFKRGAFEISCRVDVPIVAVHITCLPPILAKESPWYRAPSQRPRLRIEMLPQLLPRDWAGDSRAMARDARAGYLRLSVGRELGAWRGRPVSGTREGLVESKEGETWTNCKPN